MEKVTVLNASCKLSLADPIILVSHRFLLLWLFIACYHIIKVAMVSVLFLFVAMVFVLRVTMPLTIYGYEQWFSWQL